MPQTVIHAKKILVNGRPTFEITGFQNVLPRDKTPAQYTLQEPYYYLYDNYITRVPGRGIRIGDQYDPYQFNAMIKALKECGARLTKIRQEEAKLKPKWNGQKVSVKI